MREPPQKVYPIGFGGAPQRSGCSAGGDKGAAGAVVAGPGGTGPGGTGRGGAIGGTARRGRGQAWWMPTTPRLTVVALAVLPAPGCWVQTFQCRSMPCLRCRPAASWLFTWWNPAARARCLAVLRARPRRLGRFPRGGAAATAGPDASATPPARARTVRATRPGGRPLALTHAMLTF